MKVEWLNAEMTKVRLTRGWFRKRYALAHKARSDRTNDKNTYWFYDESSIFVGSELDAWIDAQREHGHWKPLGTLPMAIVNDE